MSAHVLLNLVNELEKREKMRGLPSMLSPFRNEFDKFNNTGERMLDSIYHMAIKLFSIYFDVKTSRLCHIRDVVIDIYATLYVVEGVFDEATQKFVNH